mmetsp:Transcript_97244/g.203117  ORF Transcript_97244/g.203117 Transcript_97244/m.203117 type:complete len:220 (-) Transcript_97244:210-869(-)
MPGFLAGLRTGLCFHRLLQLRIHCSSGSDQGCGPLSLGYRGFRAFVVRLASFAATPDATGPSGGSIFSHHAHQKLLFACQTFVNILGGQACLHRAMAGRGGREDDVEDATGDHEEGMADFTAFDKVVALLDEAAPRRVCQLDHSLLVEVSSRSQVQVVCDRLDDQRVVFLLKGGLGATPTAWAHLCQGAWIGCHTLSVFDLPPFVDRWARRELEHLVQT